MRTSPNAEASQLSVVSSCLNRALTKVRRRGTGRRQKYRPDKHCSPQSGRLTALRRFYGKKAQLRGKANGGNDLVRLTFSLWSPALHPWTFLGGGISEGKYRSCRLLRHYVGLIADSRTGQRRRQRVVKSSAGRTENCHSRKQNN